MLRKTGSGTGASTDVLLTVDGEEYWEVAVAFARIRHKGAVKPSRPMSTRWIFDVPWPA